MSNLAKGLIASLIFHIIILVSLRFIDVGVYFAEPEFVEVGLLEYVQPARVPAETHPGSIEEGKESTEEKVILPHAKEGTDDNVVQEPPSKELPPISLTDEGEAKETPSPSFIEGESYFIEGELSRRRLLYKVIPPYPEGYNIETDVKVEILVSPDGSIERLVLTKRGGEIFDRLTLDVLKEWRFEKIPTNLPQESQKGIVTFMYRLR